MADSALAYSLEGDVVVLRLDDGKANALSPDVLAELHAAFDRARDEGKSVVLFGRPGRFSAGFDLSVIGQGGGAASKMLRSGAELLMKMYVHPKPIIAACTGHAIAMGGLLLLASDTRIGTEGDFKIGLNEVAIGMTLPPFLIFLASDRLSKRHITRAALQSHLYSPATAIDAGFLDQVCEPDALEAEALAEAKRLAELDPAAHAASKLAVRGEVVEQIRRSLGS